jgi:hypothetical protein
MMVMAAKMNCMEVDDPAWPYIYIYMIKRLNDRNLLVSVGVLSAFGVWVERN